jgi:hypothetical protein
VIVWKLKALVQFLLAMVPGGQRVNYLLQCLKGTHKPHRIRKRIPALAEEMALIAEAVPLEGSCVVEIGTGWGPVATVLLYLMGAEEIHTYDHVAHLRCNRLRSVIDELRPRLGDVAAATSASEVLLAERLEGLCPVTDLAETLGRAGIVYHAPADAAKTGLPASSADLVYSRAVLEHVPVKLIHSGWAITTPTPSAA